MSDGFLGRWSRRKLDAKQGRPADPQPEPLTPPSSPAEVQAFSPARPSANAAPQASPRGASGREGEARAPQPLPTLEDVAALMPESSYARFTGSDVAAEVKNAAMKKLFSDPRYNVMDGLDVYTGDYSRPDPIPAAMLRQLAGARFLGLFDDEKRNEDAVARDVADTPTAQTVAQSSALPDAVPDPADPADPADHADPDLRLQQDDAAPGENPGRGVG